MELTTNLYYDPSNQLLIQKVETGDGATEGFTTADGLTWNIYW